MPSKSRPFAPAASFLGLLLAMLAAPPAAAQWVPDGAVVCTAAGEQLAHVAVPDGSGGVIVFWQDQRGLPTRVRAQRLNSAGVAQWSAGGIEVSSLAGAQTAPVATVDAVGGAIVAWEQDAGASGIDVWAQRLDASGVRQWGANGAIVSGSNGNQWRPLIVSDGRPVVVTTPGVIVAYESTALDAGDLYVTALDAAGALRWATFAAVGSGRQGPAVMVNDGSGTSQLNPKGVLLAWRDERVDTNEGEIYAQRVNSLGAPQWGGGGLQVCDSDALSGPPSLVQVAAGVGIVAWSRFTGLSRSDIAIRADRIGGAGSWGVNGVIVCDFGGRRGEVSLQRDGAFGAIVAWRDQRDFFKAQAYAQRVDQNGLNRWVDDGLRMGGDQAPEGMLVSGPAAGGAVLAWTDRRHGNSDVFAQRVDTTGTKLLNPWGMPVTRAAEHQFYPVVIGDGAGGAILVWTDYRSLVDADIYAQRLFDGGIVDVGPFPSPSGTLRLGAAVPNPLRAGCVLTLDLVVGSAVDAEVRSVTGRCVRTLLTGEERPAGRSSLHWDGRDDHGGAVAPGLYFVRVVSGGVAAGQRVAVLAP